MTSRILYTRQPQRDALPNLFFHRFKLYNTFIMLNIVIALPAVWSRELLKTRVDRN